MGTGEERVYVLSGSDGSLLYPPLVSPQAGSYGDFGEAVSCIPDVNGDGLSDILVGAPGEDAEGGPSVGHAYVFSGSDGALLRTLRSRRK